MSDTSGSADDTASRLACQRVVRSLMDKHEWTLLGEADLVALAWDSIPAGISASKLERLVIHQYTIALYEACQQTEDSERREQGYRELFRFLFRAAYNRWPDIAESVTQRALVLVYEQIERCQSPGTFGAFALNKLRQACKDEIRDRGKELSWEEVGHGEGEEDRTAHPSGLDQQEYLRVLIDAITRLPDKRQQQVILLKFLGGLSDETISTRLGVSVGNVRVLRHRGLAQLRKDERLRHYFEG